MLPTLGLRNLWRFWRCQMPAPFCLWNTLVPCTTRALAFQSENISRSMMWPLWLPRPPSSPKEPWWNLIALWHRGKTQALGSHRVKCRKSCGCLISASASFRGAWMLGAVWQLQIGAILSFKTLLTTAKCTMCNRDALIAQRRSFEALISSGRWRAHRGYSMLDSLRLIPGLWQCQTKNAVRLRLVRTDVFAKNEAVQVNVLLLTVFKLHCLEKQLL